MFLVPKNFINDAINKSFPIDGFRNGSGAGRSFGSSGSSSSSSSSSSSLQDSFSSITGFLGSALDNIKNAYSTSAYKSEKDSVEDYRNWSEEQARLAYERSMSSAKAQMDFQKEQADLAWQRSLDSANAQMAFQERMQKESMDYQERMSSTAYQRVVKDLKKAGLNPILAISQGSASTPSLGIPSGASASAQAMSGAQATSFMPSNVKEDNAGALKADKYVDIYSAFSALLSSASKAFQALAPDSIFSSFFKNK